MEVVHRSEYDLVQVPCITVHDTGTIAIHDVDYSGGHCGFNLHMSVNVAFELATQILNKLGDMPKEAKQ